MVVMGSWDEALQVLAWDEGISYRNCAGGVVDGVCLITPLQ